MSGAVTASRPTRPTRRWAVLVNVGFIALFVVCAWGVEPNWDRIATAPESIVRYGGLMLGGLFQNPFTEPWSAFWLDALAEMGKSIAMAWIGTLIASALSLPLAFLAASNTAPRWVVIPLRQILNLLRSIPDVLFAIVLFMPLYGLGPLAGALALGIGSIGSLGKLSYEVIEGMPAQPIEAVRSTGARPLQVMRWGVLPQVMPEIVAFWLYRFEINIRAGAILGAIGAGGIGSALKTNFQDRNWDEIGIQLLVVIVLTVAVDSISAAVRHRIIGGGRARELPRAEAAATV